VYCDLARDPLPSDVCDGIEGVFHASGIAHVSDIAPIEDAAYQRVNVDASRDLLAAAADAGVGGFVYFSSVKAAGDPPEHCVDEAWDAAPRDAYGKSKLAAERLVIGAAECGSLNACVLRPTLVYGPGVKGNLRRMIDAVAAGRFPPIPELGNRRSMVSLGDLVSAAWLAMNCREASGRTYIVADGGDYSTWEIWRGIADALGRPPPTWSIPLPVMSAGARIGDLLEHLLQRKMPLSSAVMSRLAGSACYRADRLRNELGWQPTETFYDVVAAMVAERHQPSGQRRQA